MPVPNYLDLVRELWAALEMDRLQQAAFDRAGKPGIQQLQVHFTRRVILALRAKGESAFHEFYQNPIPGTSIQLEPAVVLLDGYGPTQSCKVIGGSADDNWTFGHPQWFVADVLPNPADKRGPDVDIGPSPFGSTPPPNPEPEPEPEPHPQPVCNCADELADLTRRITALEQRPSSALSIEQIADALPDHVVARGRVSIPFLGSKMVELPVVKK